jgi:putative copper export protein
MLSINVDVIRLTLHILAATIWVGGMIVLGALAGPLRRAAPEALAPATRTFAWVAWPAFAVLIATGVWNLVAGGPVSSTAYQSTLMLKLVLVVASGVGAGLHTIVRNPTLKGIWATVALLGAVGAVLLGVTLVESP